MFLNAGQNSNDPQFLGQSINRRPQTIGSLAGRQMVRGCFGASIRGRDRLPGSPSLTGAAMVESQTPCDSNQPCAEAMPFAQTGKVPVSLRKRFLRDILGVFTMPQHAVGNAERQP
jgi:hypothetical protein